MSKVRICVICIAILGLLVFLNGIGTIDSNAESESGLYVLFDDGGVITEFTFDLTAEDLFALFPEGLVFQLLEDEPVRLSSPEALAGVWDLVDVAEGESIDHVVILYASQEVAATWGCIKCCYAGPPPLACCCKVKDEGGDE